MAILVTGGAGYIGSHTVRVLMKNGYQVVVVDDISNGHKGSVPSAVKFYRADIGDLDAMRDIFDKEDIEAVVHFAAFIDAGESVKEPKKYFHNNVDNSKALFKVMLEKNCKKIVFSSTAALFGLPERIPVKEDDLKKPVNPYGETKLKVEEILDELDKSKGLKSVCLRYFNAAGAGYGIGSDHKNESALIPIILEVALGKRKEVKIFGTDYDTKDGTPVRDFIHVVDLADAHVLALKFLESGKSDKFNLGSESGYTVKEVIEMAEEVTESPITVVEAPRRDGDIETSIADSSKIREMLGWKVKHDLKDILSSAWEWHKNNPDGFSK